jgi:hypothetical protein
VVAAILGYGAAVPIASVVALLAAVAYGVQGLAVLHRFAQARNWKRPALYLVYALLVLFSWPLVLGVVSLGFADDVADLRRRFA